MKDKVFIVIVTYNISEAIVKCLDSIKEQTHQNFHLFLVDNNSSDNTLRVVKNYLQANKQFSKKVHVARNKENIGFAKAVNIGLQQALKVKAFTVLLLNQDVYVTKDLLKNAVTILKKENNIGALGPKILYPNKKIWWIGTKVFSKKELVFSWKYSIAEHVDKGKRLVRDLQRKIDGKEMDALTGCAMFIRIAAIKKVGLFNEKYFMYAEDIDYSLRLKEKKYKLLLFASDTVFHDVHDENINMSLLQKRLKKYMIYLSSVGKYILDHMSIVIFLIWLGKLPISLSLAYLKKEKI